MSRDTTSEAARLIADEVRMIVTDETLAAYIADESGHYSLRSYESLVRTRLGGDYDPAAWEDAMDMLRDGI